MQLNTSRHYLGHMDIRFQTLQTLASVVQEMPQPTQYQCLPRQLILLSSFDWASIYSHLVALEKEGFVEIVQADNIQFSITESGIKKAKTKEIIHSLK